MTYSEFFGAVRDPEQVITWDNSQDGFLAVTDTFIGGEMLSSGTPVHPATTFAQDALLYNPFANWMATVTINAVDIGCDVAAVTLTHNNGDVKIQGSTGNQFSCASGLGQVNVSGELTLTLFDDTHWQRHITPGTLYDLIITFTTAAEIAAGVNNVFQIQYPGVDFGTYERTNSGDGVSQGATVGFTGIFDQTTGAEMIITTVGRMPA